ncbi:MAG: hypothetical protein AAF376_11885 [Pseudomonadota bacterium]
MTNWSAKRASRCWTHLSIWQLVVGAPVVLVLAFFRAGDAEFGTFVRIILSGSIVSLMIAGAIFFLAYQRQQMMIIHALMGEEAISRAIEVNPLNAWIIEQNTRLAQQLGHWADRVAFPLMTISYVVLSLSAGFAVWL